MDKLFKLKYFLCPVILIITGIFQSCSNDEVYDVTGDSTAKVFINTQDWSPVNRPANTYEFESMQTPFGVFGEVKQPSISVAPYLRNTTWQLHWH
ncbi:MAG: hypothetical protein LIP01_00505 [Tannerellaceae bacterium]|nr:hypothetical protein [Tannerellaceae bacterium]